MVQCYNCKAFEAQLVHHQENVISYQNVLLDSIEEAIRTPRGKLSLYFCKRCTFLFNAEFDPRLVGYGEKYENAQNHSPVFAAHVENRVKRILEEKGIKDHKILEIGCGNGYFVKKLISPQHRNVGIGYDKSLNENVIGEDLCLFNRYYDGSEPGDFDVVISRHVVEHILDNNEILSAIKKNNKNAQFFIETPSLEWIIKNNAFYDLFYEHCAYFSQHSLSLLFERNGIPVERIDKVFGDQYLWLESGCSDQTLSFPKVGFSEIKRFFNEMKEQQTFYVDLINKECKGKKIALWGAGAKGVTFANLVDPMRKNIQAIIDINPRKGGKFLPGTAHPIFNTSFLEENEIDIIIIMNPNYREEIIKLAKKDYHFICI